MKTLITILILTINLVAHCSEQPQNRKENLLNEQKKKLNAFAYYGGKYVLVPQLIKMIPEHKTCVEVFGGAGSFTLNKPASKVEVLNDINSDVVNFFRVLRNEPMELFKLLKLTPYARDEWFACKTHIAFEKGDVEKARKFFVKHQQGFAGLGHSWGYTISRSSATTFANKAEMLMHVAKRLRTVQIENRDYRFILNNYCKNNTIFAYLDPPYMHEARVTTNDYEFEMSADDHNEMLGMVKKSKAKILISGYASDLYDKKLSKWNRKEIEVTCTASYSQNRTTQPKRTEVLWWNYKL